MSEETVRKLVAMESPYVPKAIDVFKAESEYHIVYHKVGQPLDISKLQKESEPNLWEWVTAASQILHELKQKKLLLKALSTSMMRIDSQG